MEETINKLREKLKQKRGGFVQFDVKENTKSDGQSDVAFLDAYVISLGLHGIG